PKPSSVPAQQPAAVFLAITAAIRALIRFTAAVLPLAPAAVTAPCSVPRRAVKLAHFTNGADGDAPKLAPPSRPAASTDPATAIPRRFLIRVPPRRWTQQRRAGFPTPV